MLHPPELSSVVVTKDGVLRLQVMGKPRPFYIYGVKDAGGAMTVDELIWKV